jgi:hypothetical protein
MRTFSAPDKIRVDFAVRVEYPSSATSFGKVRCRLDLAPNVGKDNQ